MLTPVYTAYLSTQEYGIFSDLYSFVTYFLVILTFGLETSFFRFSNDDRSNPSPYNQSFLMVTAFTLLFGVITLAGTPAFAWVLGQPDRQNLAVMISIITMLDVLSALPMAKLRFDERPVVFAIISLFTILLTIVINIIFLLVLKWQSAEAVFLANLISSAVRLGLLVFFSTPAAKWVKGRKGKVTTPISVLPTSWKFQPKLGKAMANFGFFIMIAGLFGMINQNADVNFIVRIWGDTPHLYHGKLLTGEQMAGIFSANKKLAVFILLVTQAFRYAGEPFFFRHAGESKSRTTFARVFHYFMLASLFVFLLVGSFAKEISSFSIAGFTLIDSEYWSGLGVVPTQLIGLLFFAAYTSISIWFKITKQVRFGILFSLTGVIVLVLLNIILIPFFGYMGASISTMVSFITMAVMVYVLGQKYYPIPYKLGRLGLYSLLIMTAFFINEWLGDGYVGDLIFWKKLLVTVGVIALIVLTERMRPLRWKEPPAAPPAPKPRDAGSEPPAES